MRARYLLVGLSVCGIGIVGSAARADTVTINPIADTTIYQNAIGNSGGGYQAMFAGTNSAVSPRRALVQFDIADNVPSGATITGVTLTLTLAQVAVTGMGGGGGSPTIDLFDINDTWGEGTVGNNVTGVNGTGQGNTANTGDATWSDRFFSSTTPTAWGTAGGDFSSTASDSLQIVGTTVNMAYTWPTDTALVADVQNWLNTPANNFGWMLINTDETDMQTFRAFYTREAARTSQQSFEPALNITFTAVPEPASLSLAAIGCAALTLRRRRKV